MNVNRINALIDEKVNQVEKLRLEIRGLSELKRKEGNIEKSEKVHSLLNMIVLYLASMITAVTILSYIIKFSYMNGYLPENVYKSIFYYVILGVSLICFLAVFKKLLSYNGWTAMINICVLSLICVTSTIIATELVLSDIQTSQKIEYQLQKIQESLENNNDNAELTEKQK